MSRIARPAAALALLIGGFAGCAGRVLPCDGIPIPVHVDIDPGPVPSEFSQVADMLPHLLKVRAACLDARHDAQTEQGRWVYWVELEAKRSAASLGIDELEFHLTHLDRKVINYLDRGIRELGPSVSLQEFKLDALRADLRIPAGSAIKFPCAEMLNAPAVGRLRSRAAVYRVERVYTGDVAVKKLRDGDTFTVNFLPVRVAFEIDFLLEKPRYPLADDTARENAARKLEWARVANTCETCRPIVMCESLGRPTGPPPDPFNPSKTPHQVSDTSQVHVVGALDKRPHTVDAVLTQRKRTMVCTRWTPLEGTKGGVFSRYSDSSDQGLSPWTPYVTFHHVPDRKLCPGRWKVDVRLAEIVDPWNDLVSDSESAAGRRAVREDTAREACELSAAVFRQIITVPADAATPPPPAAPAAPPAPAVPSGPRDPCT